MEGDKEKRVKTFDTSMRVGRARKYIETEFVRLEEKYKFHSRMFTLVHDPNAITSEEAWGWVLFDIEKIRRILEDKKNNILFSIIAVEVHMNKGELSGYPHIHVVMYRISEGKLETFDEIHSSLRRTTSFGRTGEDIKKDGETAKKGRKLEKSNKSFLCYVLKNSKHEEPHKKLKQAFEKYRDRLAGIRTTCENCILIDNSDDKEVIDFFLELRKRNIIIDIPEEKLGLSVIQPDSMLVKHENNGVKKVTPTEAKFNKTFAMLWNYMDKNSLKLYKDNQVFKKKEGTRRTWEYWGDMDRVIGGLYTRENVDEMHDIVMNEEKLKKILMKEEQKMIPKIDINWYYIEFVDFYFHIPYFSVVDDELDPDIQLGVFNRGLSLKDLKKNEKPELWLSIVLNQDFGKVDKEHNEFCTAYYSVFLPLIQKARVMMLIGVSGSGKTTVLEPYKKLFPKNMRTEITDGKFSFETIPDKRLIYLDDVKNRALQDGNMLQLLEGGRELMINRKHVSSQMKEFKGNICIATNTIPESWTIFLEDMNNFVLKKEYEMRLKIFKFGNTVEKPRPGFLKDMEASEIAKVIMYTGNIYARDFLGKKEVNGSYLTYYNNFNDCRDKFRESESLFE